MEERASLLAQVGGWVTLVVVGVLFIAGVAGGGSAVILALALDAPRVLLWLFGLVSAVLIALVLAVQIPILIKRMTARR